MRQVNNVMMNLLAAGASLALLWLLYRLWMHRIEVRYRGRLEAQLSERMRIARELHDTLLQGMQGVLLRFQEIADRLPPDQPTAALMEQALERADAVLIEGRDRVRDLRQPRTSEQPPAQILAALASELSQESGARYRVLGTDTVRALHPVVHEEAVRIGAEALRNAFRHSDARQIEIDVAYQHKEFRLRIRDNGRGIAGEIVSRGRANHFGLRGMRERAARIGGRLHIRSELGIGTEVELRIAGGIAYEGSLP
jgi:signal transduction histidine kinase